jgi:hypothetical protein
MCVLLLVGSLDLVADQLKAHISMLFPEEIDNEVRSERGSVHATCTAHAGILQDAVKEHYDAGQGARDVHYRVATLGVIFWMSPTPIFARQH